MQVDKKPEILILVDNNKWCWFKTMQDMSYCLPEYNCTLMSADEFMQLEGGYNQWDFIYCRGSINEFVNKNNEDKMIPFISTLCTGGKLIDSRMDNIREYAMKGWAIIAQNKIGYHRCKEEGYHRVFLIPNGVNTNMYRPALDKPKEKFIGIAGNIEDRAELKGYTYLIPAVKKIKGIKLIEAGSKNPLTYEEMVRWYQSLTIYAQPSDSEGCSNSIMEAMSCGLPSLIVKGVGYHGEVCLDGIEHDNGQVIFVERDEKDIAEKIKLLLNDKELYNRVSVNARNFALQHDWRHISQKYKKVFDEFLPEARKLKQIDKSNKYGEVKICDNYDVLSDEIQDFFYDHRIKTSIKNVMNVLMTKGYMK